MSDVKLEVGEHYLYTEGPGPHVETRRWIIKVNAIDASTISWTVTFHMGSIGHVNHFIEEIEEFNYSYPELKRID